MPNPSSDRQPITLPSCCGGTLSAIAADSTPESPRMKKLPMLTASSVQPGPSSPTTPSAASPTRRRRHKHQHRCTVEIVGNGADNQRGNHAGQVDHRRDDQSGAERIREKPLNASLTRLGAQAQLPSSSQLWAIYPISNSRVA